MIKRPCEPNCAEEGVACCWQNSLEYLWQLEKTFENKLLKIALKMLGGFVLLWDIHVAATQTGIFLVQMFNGKEG